MTGILRKEVFGLLTIAAFLFFSPQGAQGSLRRTPIVAAVEKVSPAVVNISTVMRERVNPFFPFHGQDFFKDFFPDIFSQQHTRSSLGSGLIIDGAKGQVVTNYHVVARATEIKVITSDQKEYMARVIGSDPRSDLAVLQIEKAQTLPEARLGKSDDLMIGETVIAIGNPFGLSHTVTTGVVSAIDRSVRAEEQVYRHFIQTDASINPGNSGGPLLNIEGEIIGINTAIYQKAQGIGFAIPVNKVRRVVNELLRAGEVRLPWIGVEVQELTPDLKRAFQLSDHMGGILVSDVAQGSPAEQADLRRGDVLTRIHNIPLKEISDYRDALSEFAPGEQVRVGFIRKGQERSVSVQPTVFPPERAVELFYRRTGIQARDLDKKTMQEYGLNGGVMVEKVRKDSEAGRIGLQPGDLILKVNDSPVVNLEEFKKAVSRSHHQPSITVLVRRGPYGYSLTLPF
jgi:Do/DeqQ family serine protease